MLSKIAAKLGFTQVELRVIFFLLIMLFVGSIALYLKNSGNSFEIEDFDYAKQDSLFAISGKSEENLVEKSVDSEQELLDFRVDKLESGSHEEPDLSELSVNINSADISVLIQLPGIGEKTAQKIIEYRSSVSRFKIPEDLMLVKGIGQKKFLKISKFIFVE